MRAFSLVLALAVAATIAPAQTAKTPGFDMSAIDRTADPCTNFYQYACGSWMKSNPVPADRAIWGRFNELSERNRAVLRDILEKAAANDAHRSAVNQKIGDFYSACMDEQGIERKGISAIRPELDRISALADKQALTGEIVELHRRGVNALFGFGSIQDFKDSSQVIAQTDQGGIGLPDRDYYLRDDAKSVELRAQYVAHVQKMFELLGDAPAAAAVKAKTVMRIETELARGSLDAVARREPANVYHKLTSEELAKLTPSFAWPRYFSGVGAPPVRSLNVAVPEFFKRVETLIGGEPLENWKTYLTWHLVHASAPLLSSAFVNANFEFFGRTLTGAKQLRPRWKRCVDFTDNDLGEALGQEYVDRTFGAEGKQRTLKMVEALERALAQDIEQLDWMTPVTKQKALEKLHAITNKIGYPDKWRDYSSVKIVPGDAIGNDQRATEFEFRRQIAKIGQPVDLLEWQMTPPTVNAYYDPQVNNINFPAGILQPPFYDNHLDDAVNFGAIGAVIGHELTHGFDDEGRQFDAKGNLADWWSPKDAAEFEKRAACFVNEYSSFTAVGDVKLNGKLTLGENAADNGGLRIALMALTATLAGKDAPKVDGLTPEQRLFLGWGQIWCQNATEEALRLQASVNPHSPGRERVNGVVQNMPEFQKAFACKAGQPMVREPACRVW
jgi:endothelin-converting enzyme/putative endopeptidase